MGDEEHSQDDDVAIGASVARFRTARGLSQADLAERIGVAQQTVAKIEKGTRPLKYSEAAKIARVLRISTSALAARPENVIAEANAIELQHDLRLAIDHMSAVATDLAKIFVNLAVEIATDRARPPHYRAPHLQQMFFDSALPLFQRLPDTFSTGLTAGVRAAAESYGIQMPKNASGQEILDKLVNTPAEFNKPALAAMDGLAGWLDDDEPDT
ncbi:helix-turn-helix domain-containing protein [Mycobacterium seoulense]|uniref:helix-turn-helix domain-containing protein n=1 Tax=Mycobacterium seoulense TaxID=386911 RepID=UPI003CF02BBD